MVSNALTLLDNFNKLTPYAVGFDRKFTLADDIVVNGASLENGMLTIELERVIPEEKKPRLIEVK